MACPKKEVVRFKMNNPKRVICLECGSMVVPIVGEDGEIYYSPHYVPGGADSKGFCSNISKVPSQMNSYTRNRH